MNPKMKIISAVIAIGMLCSGCGNTNEENSIQNSSTNSAQVTKTESVKDTASAANCQQAEGGKTVSSTAKESKPFYGNWKITSSIGKSTVYALSEDEVKHLIGTTITYEVNVYKNGSARIDVSRYKEEDRTDDQFHKDFGIRLTDIGISASTVHAVDVCAEGEFFGATFYVKDSNTLIIYYEGVFFKAIRT